MKKLILFTTFILSFIAVIAQKKNELSPSQVPAEVTASFHKDFPTAEIKNWEKEGGSYEATFQVGNTNMSAIYGKSGYRKETEKDIEETKLPLSVFDYIKNNFSGYKIKNASQIITDKAVTTYEVEINKDNKTEGLIFDSNGKFKKKEKGD